MHILWEIKVPYFEIYLFILHCTGRLWQYIFCLDGKTHGKTSFGAWLSIAASISFHCFIQFPPSRSRTPLATLTTTFNNEADNGVAEITKPFFRGKTQSRMREKDNHWSRERENRLTRVHRPWTLWCLPGRNKSKSVNHEQEWWRLRQLLEPPHRGRLLRLLLPPGRLKRK